MRFRLASLAVAGALSLAGCATSPPVPTAPKPFGWGYSAAAERAAAAKFGTRPLKAGQWLWSPTAPKSGASEMVISLSRQKAWLYRGGDLVAVTTISSGSPGHDSPVGRFPILEKKRFHKSNRYSAAPMPFMQRLNMYGVALHGGQLPGYPASHGCIRLPMKFAERLFGATEVGTLVWVED